MPDASFPLSRRALLGGAAAVPLLGRAAQAEEQVVIATWGGDYANLLKANVEDPILTPGGVTRGAGHRRRGPAGGQDVRAAPAAARRR